ncbi:hypothetical protein MCOR07_004216 [Pyricularia oryzae]|uniref:RecA family profile 1 domain-containing protein n=4 Tax=Pyricularia TaxID=48558 RepID=A0ABQ8NAC8_PYRGI|nr:uncharacterized protein MGG_06985 [Pyricularia oryzae 70-15]ELQ36416.1 hypothetical protein OOU_Y34scaffold00663g16 [Pyricularia oryzae Y34]KAH8842123.1 hypothetical protein MCOR01_006058 [Pyricularia oryzae]KAI6293895.1 hypothetical protein MCOR33_008810 [Pyricularia grisea]EHA57124.1 hypothetical protein MGG_06985 [Pyricularia oryzae 70-15]KAI6266019.1 hypothetical protein MCOR26_010437 [Pyricularia oryzae]
MTDLLRVLPHFPVGQYAALIPALEKHEVTTTELLTLDATEIGKRTQLPLLDIKRLCAAVLRALHSDLGVALPASTTATVAAGNGGASKEGSALGNAANVESQQEPQLTGAVTTTTINHLGSQLRHNHAQLAARWSTISTLDPELDAALGGGIPTGYVTEITGESGAGKTQFLLSLLLAVQLPPPHGLGRKAMYIPTEAALSTRRVAQMLAANPLLLSASPRPSLDSILSLQPLGDIEAQDHILSFQVPLEAARRNVGLIILDSVAANFRAEYDAAGSRSTGLAARSAELVRLGMQLRNLARSLNLAVVVANQVADRFESKIPMRPHLPLIAAAPPSSGEQNSETRLDASSQTKTGGGVGTTTTATTVTGPIRLTQESPLASRSRPLPASNDPPSSSLGLPDVSWPRPVDPFQPSGPDIPALLLDHQQRWFTGWGDEEDDSMSAGNHKTPSLGLVWSTQISARIALLKKPIYGRSRYQGDDDDGDGMNSAMHSWRRWMKVVFAPHVAPSGPGLDGAVEYEIYSGGLKGTAAKGPSGKGTIKRKRSDSNN